MQVNTAIAVDASVRASVAAQQAARAKRIACEKFVTGFEHSTATVQQRQQYAECVQVLYPTQMGGAEILWLKAAILATFIGLIVGLRCGYKDAYDRSISMFMYGFLGAIGAPLAIGIIWFVVQCLKFLVTA